MADDPLDDFAWDEFTADGVTHPVLRSGTGPAVLVISEIPGISPHVAGFARRVRDIGCTVVLPNLFGTAGRDHYPVAHGWTGTAATMARTLGQVCVSREFSLFATGRTSPVVKWLRALAAQEHERCGGPGVGAIGMCLTGGFALAMAVDDRLIAPVVAHPSLPLALTPRQRASIDISPSDLAKVRKRCDAGLTVLGLRFRSDRLVPDERFAFLRRTLGEAFVAIELDDAAANPRGLMRPHAPVTDHLIDEPGEPTRDALDQVLDLFRTRLLAAGGDGQGEEPED
ncbi:dienelactone hydrolase family protein [Actinocorallia lasiicapitis]